MTSRSIFTICVFVVSLFGLSIIPLSSSQDQVEIPSWEVGWETDVDGVYELSISGDNDILDSIDFFIANERMTEINLEITIDWDESDNIPIELEYDESVSVAASDNQTFTIEISDVSGYSFKRSPTQSMTLLLSAQEVVVEQAITTQEIDAELTVPSVFDLVLESATKDETLYSGSSIEYVLIVTNHGNTKDVIKMPESSVKSCPNVDVEGLDVLRDVEVDNSTSSEYTIRISASESQPERLCEVTISIKSAGNDKLSSTVFEVSVNSNAAPDDASNSNNEQPSSTPEGEITEADTLSFIPLYESILVVIIAVAFGRRNNC